VKVGDLIRHKRTRIVALVLDTAQSGGRSTPGCYIQFRWLDDGTMDSCHSSLFEVISESR